MRILLQQWGVLIWHESRMGFFVPLEKRGSSQSFWKVLCKVCWQGGVFQWYFSGWLSYRQWSKTWYCKFKDFAIGDRVVSACNEKKKRMSVSRPSGCKELKNLTSSGLHTRKKMKTEKMFLKLFRPSGALTHEFWIPPRWWHIFISCSPVSKHSSTQLQVNYLAVFIVLSLVTNEVGRDESQPIKQNFLCQSGNYFGRICHGQDIFSHCELY